MSFKKYERNNFREKKCKKITDNYVTDEQFK